MNDKEMNELEKEFEELIGFTTKAKILPISIGGNMPKYGTVQYDEYDYADPIDLADIWNWFQQKLAEARLDAKID